MAQDRKLDFSALNYDGFARLAQDDSLSRYEKIGFPDSYRDGFEAAIFEDILAKLPRLAETGLTVADIGPGCSELPHMMSDRCRAQGHTLWLIDSPEMLSHLPDDPHIRKVAGPFPACAPSLQGLNGKIDVLLCYSVLHYIYVDANLFDFIDAALSLLAPGGAFLIGDIPNISKRNRFFATAAGVAFHQEFTQSKTLPEILQNTPVLGKIDDAVLFGLMQRARAAGADAYLLPQPARLPMANRREDILIRKP